MAKKTKNRYPYRTKSDLVQIIAKKCKINKTMGEIVVNKVLESISSSLQKGHRVEIRNFGTFELRHYKAYKGRNPQTGEKISVKAKTMPFFKIGKMKEVVNNKK